VKCQIGRERRSGRGIFKVHPGILLKTEENYDNSRSGLEPVYKSSAVRLN
jgi:hypothetical protein